MCEFNSKEKEIFLSSIRFVSYFFVLIALSVWMWKLAEHYGRDTFGENGIVENSQNIVLLASSCVFGWLAWMNKTCRSVLLCLGSLCLLGLCREQDAWFDEVLPIVSWRIGYLFPCLAALNGLRQPAVFKRQVLHFLQTPAFYLMFAAMMMVIPFAQCIGHKSFIAAVVASEDGELIRALRRMIEESGELMGYALILLAGIELFLNIKSVSKK